eukprot:SAG31_NODE_1703_length_7495_cov_3.115062_8_plen_42_part_00
MKFLFDGRRERHKDYLEELMRYGTQNSSKVYAHSCEHTPIL